MSGKVVLRGEVESWKLAGTPREYMVVTLPFGVARQIFKADIFKADSGNGEQRGEIEAWTKRLEKEMRSGNYTPTSISVGTRRPHRQAIVRGTQQVDENTSVSTVELTIDLDKTQPLPLLNGFQRFCALNRIRKAADEEGQKAVDAQPITAMVYLDGASKADFINLNIGKPVNPALLLSLRVHQKSLSDRDQPNYRLALDIAKKLAKDERSAFERQIRFDSSGSGGLSINSLCQKGSSDLATSLIGLAKVGIAAHMDADCLAEAVILAYETLDEKASVLLENNRVLTPPPDGTKGAASMLLGLGVCLAYRLSLPDANDDVSLERLVKAAYAALDQTVDGNFSGPEKRAMMGEFATEFFADLEVEKHHGVPKQLVEILSASAFGLPKLPKEKKPRRAARSEPEQTPVEVSAPTGCEQAVLVPAPVVCDSGTTETFEPVAVATTAGDVAPWEEIQA